MPRIYRVRVYGIGSGFTTSGQEGTSGGTAPDFLKTYLFNTTRTREFPALSFGNSISISIECSRVKEISILVG